MKFLLGLALLISSTIIGYVASAKYSKKREFFEAFSSFNKRFMGEVGFSQKSLINLVGSVEEQNDFNRLIYHKLKNMNESAELKYLTDDEKVFVKSYVDNLGIGDKNTQLEYLKGVTARIESGLKDSLSEEKKYKSLYIKIGFLIGLIGLVALL